MKPVLSVEAWARWRRASEYEDLLAEERVLGDKRRAGPDGVDADRAHQRCPSADGPQHVLDGPATFVDASTDGRLDGPGQPVQHAGLLSHRVLGSRGRGTRFSQQRLTVLRRKPLLCGWTGQVASTGQRRYSDLAIETALTLRLLYHLPLRQAEGFLHALFGMMRLDLSAPDYTTLSRRSQHLRRRLRPVPPGEAIHLVLDSTGLSIVGAGEWATAKHGGRSRRGWRKLHLGVDQSGVIRVHTLTEATGDDATTALDLLTAVEGPLVRVTADAAYDTVAVYETAGARGATVVVPPAKTANISGHGPRSSARDRTIQLVKKLGRRRWKQASGYHRQGRVENAFFRYKSIIGDDLRARSPAGQGSEVVLGCEILNRMTALGRPASYRIGR